MTHPGKRFLYVGGQRMMTWLSERPLGSWETLTLTLGIHYLILDRQMQCNA